MDSRESTLGIFLILCEIFNKRCYGAFWCQC
jgi:hypothetical protein